MKAGRSSKFAASRFWGRRCCSRPSRPLLGVLLYLAPPQFASVSSVGDFVAVNDVLFAVRSQAWLTKLLHLPDNDPPNDNIRLITIDEAMNAARSAIQGTRPRTDPALLHRRLTAQTRQRRREGRRLRFGILRAHARSERRRVVQGTVCANKPTVLGMTVDVTQGGIMSKEMPPPELRKLGKSRIDHRR